MEERKVITIRNKTSTVYKNAVSFNGPDIMATDPCYSKDTWCTFRIQNILPGNYVVRIKTCENWGHRVKQLEVIHEDYYGKKIEYNKSRERIDVGVDAGLCGFFENKPDYTDDEWDEFCEFIYDDEDGYFGTLDNPFKCNGVCTPSGYGDGTYPVSVVRREDHKAIAFKIKYI